MFLERIMPDGPEEHDEKVCIDGINITRLRFADEICALVEEKQELKDLVESLDNNCTRYKMEIGAKREHLVVLAGARAQPGSASTPYASLDICINMRIRPTKSLQGLCKLTPRSSLMSGHACPAMVAQNIPAHRRWDKLGIIYGSLTQDHLHGCWESVYGTDLS